MRLNRIWLFTVIPPLILFLLSINAYAFQEPPVRVALEIAISSIEISSKEGMIIREIRNGILVEKIEDSSSIKFSPKGKVLKTSTGHESDGFVVYPVKGFLRTSGKEYRGTIQIIREGDGLTVINILPLEEYLQSVVPSEMPSGWHSEALKAQAIAARTYALNRMRKNAQNSFDVYDSVADQAYNGAAQEHDSTNTAVKTTRGMTLSKDGEPIIAYYSSSAGGCTADPAHYTGEGFPYLRSVPSPDEDSHAWRIIVSASELLAIAKSDGVDIGKPLKVSVYEYAPSGRVTTFKIEGSKKSVIVSATKLRKFLGYNRLKSTRFAFGENPVFPPISVSGAEPMEVFAREVLSQVLMKLGAGTFAVLGEDGIDEIRLSQSVSLGASGKSYLGIENYAAGFEVQSIEYTTPSDSESVVSSTECLQVVQVGDGVTISGVGFGHGKGLSQYGAKALAEDGWSFEQILHHYYYQVDIVLQYE